MYRQSKKNLLSSNISSTCPHNMVNFGPLAAEIVSLVWGTPGHFNGFRVLAALLHGTLVVGDSQNAALNKGRHLYSAGRPSRWAFAHISSSLFFVCFYCVLVFCIFFFLNFVLPHGVIKNERMMIERVQALADISRSALCCHSNETRVPIANPPNSAQREGTPTIPPIYIRVRAVIWACGREETDRHTTQTHARDQYIHFLSSTPHAKWSSACTAQRS